MKFMAWCCIIAAALAAMAISYSGLDGLARMVGYGDAVAPLLPIAIDVAIVGATLVWLGAGAPARAFSFARVLAMLAILTSVLANATFHGLSGGGRWWLASIVASIPPAFLAALVHLGALLVRHDAEPPAPTEAASPPPVPTPEPGEGLVTIVEPAPPVASVQDQVRQILDDAAAAGQPAPGRPTIARQLGASEHQVRKVLDSLRQSEQ
jgi:hypothetical protein